MTEMDELIPDATPLATPRKGLRQWELTPEMLSRLDALAEEYGLIAQPEQPQSIEPEGGFAASAKRAAGAGIKGAGQAAADFIPGVDQDNALKKYGQSVIDANPTAVNSPEDIADKPGQGCNRSHGKCHRWPAAPLVAAAGQVVSWLGPAAIAALPSFGGIRDKQILVDPDNQESAKAKAILLSILLLRVAIPVKEKGVHPGFTRFICQFRARST